MDDDFNYICNQWTITQLSRINLLESNMVLLPIGRNGHWLLATADLRTRTIYHDDPVRGIHGTLIRNGATLLKDLLTDLEHHMGNNNDKGNWTCYNAVNTQAPQQTGNIDCGVFVCAFATLFAGRVPLDLACLHTLGSFFLNF